ncbi:MAG: HprK-related kinase B [Desulfovibrionaceae bacterium]|nr:HprK-related kinase B [Desulfovibrionaceae bacterium]MBF0512862.1 HprK-related kinase B [Desulfovibrionaceae bacterium]
MSASIGNLKDLLAAAKATGDRPHRLFLVFDQCRVLVETNSRELADRLKAYYADFLGREGGADITVKAVETPALVLDLSYTATALAPGKTPKEEYADLRDARVVHKVRTGMVFAFGGGENYALGPCLANDPQVVNFINNRHIELVLKQGALLFHAAAVARKGKGLALVGFSGAGKSTLALQILTRGMDFVSNDRLMVSRRQGELRMAGVAKMPRVNPGTVLNNPSLKPVMDQADWERFSRLSPAELWDLEHKYDASIDACFGPGRFKLTAGMAGLVVLNWKREAVPMRAAAVSLRERRDLLEAFMKSPGLFYALDDPAAIPEVSSEVSGDAYLALLDGCPVLEVTGGVDFDRAADAALDFFDRCGG